MASRRRPKYRVFVSHSHHDRWIAKQCVRLIEEAAKGRVSTFIDELHIEGGTAIPDVLRDAIVQCDEFVAILTPESYGSVWVQNEIGAAWGHKKLIVAIVHKIDSQQIPAIIRFQKAIALNDFDQYLEELAARVRGGGKE